MVSLLLSAFPAAFFVANAAGLYSLASAQATMTTEFVSGVIDASGHNNLMLSFNYEAELLDDRDSFEYGWRAGAGDNDFAPAILGADEGGPSGDETGFISVPLPAGAQVANLEVYVRASVDAATDVVNLTNISVSGDAVAPATVNITNITELRDAIENQADGQTWTIQAGDYGLDQSSAIVASGQTGWYFPIVADDVTINGVGNPTVFGATYSANGAFATQNLISVFGDNVTITGLTLMPKVEPNKTIEVIGEDFTLEDVVFAPNTKVPESLYDSIADVTDWEDSKQWGGSLYFSHEGNHVIKNVTINNGGVSFRYSPSGTDITFDNVEIVNETNVDWINGYRFSSAFNNSSNSTTGLPQVTYRINDTLDNAVSVFENAQDGDTVEFDSDITTTQELVVETAVTINGNGFTITPDFTLNGGNNSVLEIFDIDSVEVNDLVIDSGLGNTKNLHGINIYESDDVTLNSVISKNNGKSGVVVNGSGVTVDDITTSGNGWHGINVDQGGNVTQQAKLTIKETSSHDESWHIYLDNVNNDVQVVDVDGQYDYEVFANPNDVKNEVANPRTSGLYTLKSAQTPAAPTSDNPKVVVTDLSPITVNAGSVAGASIDYSSLLTDDNSTKTTGTLPATTINSDVANVTILADTIVTGPTGWDGVIDLPSAGLSGGTAPSGFTVGGTVIEVGSPSITLNFNKAVKITLLGVTGDVGYKPAGSDTWQTIDTQCTSATDSSNISSGECYFTSGNNTVIWTYHFTSFGGLNPVLTSSGGGSGGSSSGTRIRDRVEPTPLVLGVTDSLLPTDEELTGVLTSVSGILAGIQSGYEAGDISDEDATKLVAQLSEILTILLGLYQ